jgi:thiol-disulfide isomerase/thioredoxin
MKNIIKFSTLCLFFLGVIGAPVIAKAQGIEFGHDLGEALKKAKAEKKLVFVDFYTSWCAPCKVMTAEVFPLPNVGTYFNSNFISCKVQCDDKGIGVELGNKYKIIAYPTLMFLNGDGELVHSFVGSTSGNGLIEAAKVALNPDKNLLSAIKQWDSGDRSKEFVASYFAKLKKVYQYEKYTNDFNAYFNKLSANEKTDKSTFDLIKLVNPAPFSPIFEYIEKNRNGYAKTIGVEVVDKYISNGYLWYLKNTIKWPRTEYNEAMAKFKARKYPYYDEFAMFYTAFEAFNEKGGVDINEYMRLGTAFLDKYGKNNDSYTMALTSLLGNCTGRPNEGQAGIKWMENLLARNPDPTYMNTYFYITWRNFQFEKALEIGNKIRETAIKNKQSTAAADKNITMINDLIVKYKDRAVKSSKTDK